MNHNQLTLVRKNKASLLRLIEDELSFIREDDNGDVLYAGLENIEQIVYVLKNCNYEGSEQTQ